MRYLDICSGISAPTMAWRDLGWTCAGYSEIEKFPRAVLAERYGAVPVDFDHRHVPGSNVTPLFGDFTQIEAHHVGPIDLLVGGTPCQDFSVAGLRKGLAGDRGNLSLEYLRLADRTRPRWLVWENVPGVLSQDGGRAFGAILGGMGELGYGFAYRVFDAQFAGVPQRRRRVFVVGHLGDWRRAAAVLSERHSLQGHSAPRRETGQAVAALTANGVGTRGADDNQGQAGHLIPAGIGNNNDTARSLTASHTATGRLDPNECTLVAHSLRGEGFDASEDGTGRGTPLVPVCFTANDYGADASEIAPTLRAGGFTGSHANGGVMPAVCFDTTQITSKANYSNPKPGDPCHPLAAGAHPPAIATKWAVRRLTPTECHRLQGFPDDHCAIAYRGKPAADGPQYKALGNSMAVPDVRWIGERIALVDAFSPPLTSTQHALHLTEEYGLAWARPQTGAV